MVQSMRLLALILILAAPAFADYKKQLEDTISYWQKPNVYADGVIEYDINSVINSPKSYGNLQALSEYRVKY